MNFINELSGCELIVLANLLAIYFSQGLSADETDILGNFFNALGSNLSVLATSKSNTIIEEK
ncbi:MAG: hypothetical protein HFJ53_03540 [Clostridia bacterium]|jgi:hypothetical protein|nr:hypothetical protein [Clostridia bacterium]